MPPRLRLNRDWRPMMLPLLGLNGKEQSNSAPKQDGPHSTATSNNVSEDIRCVPLLAGDAGWCFFGG